MNRYVNIGLAFGMSAFLGAAADLSAQAKPQTAKPQTAKPSSESSSQAGSVVNLGAVSIPRAVKAGGEPLPAGTYQVRVTETPATPQAVRGRTPFVDGMQVAACQAFPYVHEAWRIVRRTLE